MTFFSKLRIFSKLLRQANLHKIISDPDFEGFHRYCKIYGPTGVEELGQLEISAEADTEARFILTMIWDEAMNNFDNYPLPLLKKDNRLTISLKNSN